MCVKRLANVSPVWCSILDICIYILYFGPGVRVMCVCVVVVLDMRW